jgi:hypothetical protein
VDNQANPDATTRMPMAIGHRVPIRATKPPTNGETSRKTTDSGMRAAPVSVALYPSRSSHWSTTR